MNFCIATFYSNSRYYKYPIDVWKSQVIKTGVKDIFIFKEPDEIIKNPIDISKIQNKYLLKLKNEGYKSILWIQADIYFNPDNFTIISKKIGINKNYGFGVMEIKNFFELYQHQFGITLINDYNNLFTGDGAYTHSDQQSIIIKDRPFGYQIGQYSPSITTRKKKNHSLIWKGSEDTNQYESIRTPISLKNNIHRDIMQKLGIIREYENFHFKFI